MSINQRMSSSANSTKFPSTATPALLNNTVALPCCDATASANAFTCASSATFTTCCVTLPCGEPSKRAVSANSFSFTSEIASADPIAANCCAKHLPIPDPAPVITATPSLRNDMASPVDWISHRTLRKSPFSQPLSSYHTSSHAANVAITSWPAPLGRKRAWHYARHVLLHKASGRPFAPTNQTPANLFPSIPPLQNSPSR